MQAPWDRVESAWPAPGQAPEGGYQRLRDRAWELLDGCGIATAGFSHFGLVVSGVEEALGKVRAFDGPPLPEVTSARVEAYQVDVARFALGGAELEFIAPRGGSFFAEHLRAFGEGLHHLSFRVHDIADALQRLAASGVVLIDREPRCGSHGKVAFSAPGALAPVRLEVYQSTGHRISGPLDTAAG